MPVIPNGLFGVIARKNAGGGISYYFEENFETPTTGYENTWAETGSPNPVYTTTALQGTQSFATAGVNSSESTITATGDIDGYFLYRNTGLPGASSTFFTLTDGTNLNLEIQQKGSGGLRLKINGGLVDTSATISANTTYHVWVHYTKGSGSDAFGSVAFSTDGTRPTSGTAYAEKTNGAATTDVTKVRLGTYDNLIADRVLLLEGTIGDNP